MAQNSSESGENSTIDTKINSQVEEKALSAVSNALNTTPQPHSPSEKGLDTSSNAVSLLPKQNPPASQNGETDRPLALMDLSRPIKTEGEASPIGSSTTTLSGSTNSTDHNQGTTLTDTLTPMSALVPQLGTLGSQLTPEVQAAAYKKANILALSALAKKGGPNAKEMLAVQQKLQEFLTSLITLAGQKGPQLKVAIQMHVQHLVTGQISEEEFAKRIENDLNSQHQPSLLPFLKSSVPHLKTRLQLQQAIMKELLQRQLAEKQSSPATNAVPQQKIPSPPAPSVPQTKQSNASLAPQGSSTLSSSSSSTPLQQTQVKAKDRVPTPTKNLESQAQNPPKGNSPNEPIVIPSSTSNQQPGQNLVTPNATVAATNVVLGLPKNLLEQLAKLPPEQQKFVYMHQYRRMQLLKQSQQQQQQQNGTTNSALPGRLPVGISLPPTSQANAQTIAERQQQLIKEQQVPLIMGGGRVTTGILGAASSKPLNTASKTNQGSISATSTGNNSKGIGRTSFANMKLVPGSLSSSSGHSPGKGKGKSKGKDVVDANDEDDEVVGMDLLDEVGVNLQEETAHFLPQTVGETPTRTVADEVFLDLPLLKRKVAVIAKRHGISEIPEDFITLLSHATQERMSGVMEKLTLISQHRVQTLKDDEHYQLKSETRSQLRILESIDRIFSKRKQERENEITLKAARSRSKGTDPEKAAKIREEAKQIQQDEAARLRNEAANLTALAAIGSRRKRPSPDSNTTGSSGESSTVGSSATTTNANSFAANLFAPLSTTRAPKRHITSRDLIFYMEQERETRKSIPLYKALLK